MSRYDEDNDDDTDGHEPRGRRGHGSRRRRIVGWIAVITTVLVTGTSLVAYAAYLNTLHSIETFSTAGLGSHRPPAYDASENILLVGSDSRAGNNQKFGKYVQGQRSDTMLIVHIRPHHQGAVVVSLPRDSEVPILACKADTKHHYQGQPALPGQDEMLNATFALGGPLCLWKTVEQETGIRIDHYVGLTFSGFINVINDIGGVNVCLPKSIHDPKSGLNLGRGEHHVKGFEALAFWRERYVGEGSDLQRIQRQQYLMAGLMQEVKNGGLLSNYPRMYSVLRDSAKALTVDQGLSLSDMVSLAENLRSLNSRSVRFITVPNGQDPTNANRVVWSQPAADHLFNAIEHDTSIPKSKKNAVQPTTTVDTVSPSKVQVEVLNGNGIQGAAGQAASDLTSKGFHVVGTTNATNSAYTDSIIEYSSPAERPMANTLKARLSSVQVQQVPGLAPGTIDLIVGSTFTGLTGSSPASGSPSPGSSASPGSGSGSNSAGHLSKSSYGGINGGTNICSDSGAFTGPDNPNKGT
jgi:LCP family protein required for cell wall assembly